MPRVVAALEANPAVRPADVQRVDAAALEAQHAPLAHLVERLRERRGPVGRHRVDGRVAVDGGVRVVADRRLVAEAHRVLRVGRLEAHLARAFAEAVDLGRLRLFERGLALELRQRRGHPGERGLIGGEVDRRGQAPAAVVLEARRLAVARLELDRAQRVGLEIRKQPLLLLLGLAAAVGPLHLVEPDEGAEPERHEEQDAGRARVHRPGARRRSHQASAPSAASTCGTTTSER